MSLPSTSRGLTAVRPVVVAVDGRPESGRAVEWAAREAALHGHPLRVVHTFVTPFEDAALTGYPYRATAFADARAAAEKVVADAISRAGDVAGRLQTSGAALEGSVLTMLVEASKDAALLVLGTRHRGAVARTVLGSTSCSLAARAHCPVAVIGAPATPDGPVVVGVDGSRHSVAAVGYAFAEASERSRQLVAIHTWQPYAGAENYWSAEQILEELRVEAELTLSETMAGWAEKYPEVAVEQRVVRGSAADVLTDASATAELVVVGAKGRHARIDALLGSVSQALVHSARGPLVVVHPKP